VGFKKSFLTDSLVQEQEVQFLKINTSLIIKVAEFCNLEQSRELRSKKAELLIRISLTKLLERNARVRPRELRS
jgi:hypothetical protein